MTRAHTDTTAIFLGAGASAAYGLPITSRILPLIREQCENGTLFRYAKKSQTHQFAKNLRMFMDSLLPGYGSEKELPLVTDIISLLDYSLLISTSPIRRTEIRSIRDFRELLERAISEIVWPIESNPAKDSPELGRTTKWLLDLSTSTAISIITSNYDMAVDHNLANGLYAEHGFDWSSVHGQFDFGFAWRDPFRNGMIQPRPPAPRFQLYKLHGSVNWAVCEMCEHIYINLWAPIGQVGYDLRSSQAHATRSRGTTCLCDHKPLRPVLVAPSLVRDIRSANLLEIWKHALEALRQADQWIIIGYSFPPEDLAIRSMFIRAWQGRKRKPKVTVVQKGEDSPTHARYRILFPQCEYLTGGLEQYLATQLA